MVNREIVFIILLVAFVLLVGCFLYLQFNRKKNRAYEEALVQEIKFENKLKSIDKEQAETNKQTMDIESMLNQMQKDLENQNNATVVDFEQTQEESSIISYKELKKAVEEFTEDEELAQEQSPISVKEVLKHNHPETMVEEPIFSLIDETPEKIEVEVPTLEEPKKFQSTEFISPIYGKQEPTVTYPHIPVYKENEEVLEVLEERDVSISSVTSNEEFLNELRDFRNQL